MKLSKLQWIAGIALILLVALFRVLNNEQHIYNLVPIAALGLFAGSVAKPRYAFLFALLAQFLGDCYFEIAHRFFGSIWQGFYGINQLFVYGALLLVTLLGTLLRKPNALKIAGFSISGSLLFFLVSNFGVWVAIQTGQADLFGYGTGLEGLKNTYLAALPFYKTGAVAPFSFLLRTVVGDLIGCGIMFGGYALLQRSLFRRTQNA